MSDQAAKHECQRCGMCCKGKGDLAYGCDTVALNEDCPALSFDENGLAVCGIHGWKPSFCDEYPFSDIDNGICKRQQREAGIWLEYVLVNGELGRRNQKGEVTMCKRIMESV